METIKINANKFESIQDLLNLYDNNYSGKHIKIEVDNGCIIEMKRKCTYYANGKKNVKVVKTNYAHIIMMYPNGTHEYIKESKGGKFTTITSPYEWQQIKDFRI